jgi:hypothetical protein
MTKRIILSKFLELIPNGQNILLIKDGRTLSMFLKRKLNNSTRTRNKSLIGTYDEALLFSIGITLNDIISKYEYDNVIEKHIIILEDN